MKPAVFSPSTALQRILSNTWLLGLTLLALVLVVGGYVAYVLIDYHRIGDQELAVQNGAVETSIAAGETYKIVSYNIGFGAYESDYGFFMDGGTESRAWSEERLTANLDRIARTLTDWQA